LVQANLLRSIVYAIAAGFLIFSQDHSLSIGATAIEFVGAAIVIAGGALMLIPAVKVPVRILATPVVTSFAVTYFFMLTGEVDSQEMTANGMFAFRMAVALFIVAPAINELWLGSNSDGVDRAELLISAGIGFIAGLIYLFIPLDPVNAVGILSAYFAISAVQRAIWIASTSRKGS